MKKIALLVLSLVAAVTVSNAQVCALKSNVIYLGAGGVNLGAEFSVAPQWTIDVSGTAILFSPWKNTGDGLYLNGWDAVVEGRYYLCKAFNGHHFGVFGEAARFGHSQVPFNIYGSGQKMQNVQAAGLGVSYGYYFKLNTYWGIDCTVGMGAAVGRYTTHNCATGNAVSGWKVLPLPRAQVAFSYKF